jgi:protein SCO1
MSASTASLEGIADASAAGFNEPVRTEAVSTKLPGFVSPQEPRSDDGTWPHQKICRLTGCARRMLQSSYQVARVTKPMTRRELVNWGSRAAVILVMLAAVFENQAAALVRIPAAGENIHFALTGADGRDVTEQSYRGKWLVVYFGYTFCPDICPTTMLEIAGALEALGPRANAVEGIFVTVDPDRDTPEVLGDYLKSFDPRLIGLTGTSAQISEAAKSFGVLYERQDRDDGTYLYDHSAFIYLVDAEGRLVKAVAGDNARTQIADTLSGLMQAGH